MRAQFSLALLVPLVLAQCDEPPQEYASYSALGDSYSAGFGSVQRLGLCSSSSDVSSQTCTSDTCAKDIGSYAYRLAAEHAEKFQYLTCSGANTTTILEGQVQTSQFGSPDLVTLTAGGNDYETFFNLMTQCVVLGTDADCQKTLDTAMANLPLIYSNVETVLEAINNKVPSAEKVLLGYIQFFGHEYPDLCVVTLAKQISVDIRKQINNIVSTANEQLSELAEKHGFLFVSADPLFEGHRWCDVDSQWLISDLVKNGVDTQNIPYSEIPFAHPTADGQTAYLTALQEGLGYSS